MKCGSIVLVCLLALLATVVGAQPSRLISSVDRSTLHANESLTYLLRAEGVFRAEPDMSGLERDFDILDRSQSTRVQIVNGQAFQIGEWQLRLMPRGPGRFTLPPATLDGVASNGVAIEVLPALAGDVPGDIFLELDVGPTVVYAQAQLVYTLRIFRGVSTGRASLSALQVTGGEAIVEALGQDREYEVLRDGRSFSVRERRFAIFPQAAGHYTIEPVTFEAIVVAPSGFSSIQRFRSRPVTFEALAPVPPPPEWASAAWLPASRLTLTERWSDDPAALTVGIPQTRTLTLEAAGVLDTQLPGLVLPPSPGLRQYADQPELVREAEADGLRVRRTERLAVIAQQAGELALPAVELPWWNVTEQRWEVARLEPRRLQVAPSTEIVAATEPLPAASPRSPAAGAALPWPWISLALAVGWLATVLFGWRGMLRRPQRRRSTVPEPVGPRRSDERRLLRQLREACAARDPQNARRLLLAWGKLRFRDDPPLSLGALAARLPVEAATEVAALEACLYGPPGGTAAQVWDGQGLMQALRRLDAVERPAGAADSTDPLLPLYR